MRAISVYVPALLMLSAIAANHLAMWHGQDAIVRYSNLLGIVMLLAAIGCVLVIVSVLRDRETSDSTSGLIVSVVALAALILDSLICRLHELVAHPLAVAVWLYLGVGVGIVLYCVFRHSFWDRDRRQNVDRAFLIFFALGVRLPILFVLQILLWPLWLLFLWAYNSNDEDSKI
jgi:uncharacterized membrane protein